MAETPAAKRRGAKAPPAAGAAPHDNGTGFTDQQLATLKLLFGNQAPAPALQVGPTPSTPQVEDDDDDEADRAEILADERRQERQRRASEEALTDEVLRLLIEPRHMEIFVWLRDIQGKTSAQLVKEFLRGSLIRERQAFRESKGKGGNSSRDIATLTERLPGSR